MNDCLVTKLKYSVLDNSFSRLGSLVFKVTHTSEFSFLLRARERSGQNFSRINVIEGDDIYKIGGSSPSEENKRGYNIPSTEPITLEFSAGTYILEITNKYNLTHFANMTPGVALEVLGNSAGYLINISTVDSLLLHAKDLSLSTVSTWTNLRYINFGKGVYGDLSNIYPCTKIISITSNISSLDDYLNITGDLGDLPYLSNLTTIRLSFSLIRITASKLTTTTKLTEFSVAYNKNIVGTIGCLKNNKEITRINVQFSNLSGDLNEFVNSGRTSGNIRLSGAGTNITYNGAKLPNRDLYINFKADGSITVTDTAE